MIDEYTSNPKGDFTMATAQQVIKNFMSYLDNTTEYGETALNNAIKVCSRGICNTMQEAINYMVNDIVSYSGNGMLFLRDKCGIIFDNKDIGSIIGADAGGIYELDEHDIVYEDPKIPLQYPTDQTSFIHGVTVKWPNLNNLSVNERHIISCLNTFWLDSSFNVISNAFNMSLDENDVVDKTLTIEFINNSDRGGYASYRYDKNYNGYNLTIQINSTYYADLDLNSIEGAMKANSPTYYYYYIDRMILHELTHSVMEGNIRYFGSYPAFIVEGAAQLTMGMDDWKYDLINIASTTNVNALNNIFSISSYQQSEIEAYAGGYIFYRYIAKQLADVVDNSPWKDPSTVTGVTLSGNNKLVMTDGYNDWLFDLNSYIWHDVVKNVSAIDASSMTNRVGIIGRNDRANTIIGGHGETQMLGGANQSDTLTGGSGTNIFWFGSNHGSDTITNFNSVTDTLKLFDGVYCGCSTSGNDVIINSNNAAINLKNMANQKMRVELGDGIYNCIFANQSTENVFDFDKSINYFFGSNAKKDTIKAHTGDYWVDLNAAGCVNADVLDAKDVTDTVYLLGSNNNSMTIYGGQGHTEMLGGYGQNDTLVGGNSDNVFWFGTGYGNDIITNMDIDDTINLFTGNVTNFGITGNDYAIIMDNNNSITIQGGLKDGAKVSVASLNATFVYDSTVEGNWRNA